MKHIREPLKLVAEFRRPYIALNVAYYGLIVLAMTYVARNPSVQETLLKSLKNALTTGPFALLGEAYTSGRVLRAMILTFTVNLLVGSFLWITVPSLVIPYIGILAGCWRAAMWGLLLCPSTAKMARVMIPHSLTLILEGQAYILAMLGVYIQGRAFLHPHTVGAASRVQGYRTGFKRSVRLYVPIVILLAAAAVYEALEVIFLAPRLAAGAG